MIIFILKSLINVILQTNFLILLFYIISQNLINKRYFYKFQNANLIARLVSKTNVKSISSVKSKERFTFSQCQMQSRTEKFIIQIIHLYYWAKDFKTYLTE